MNDARSTALSLCVLDFEIDRRLSPRLLRKPPRLDFARQFSDHLKKSVSTDWDRKWLHIARQTFGDLLVNEVSRMLEDPIAEVEQELAELGFLDRFGSLVQRSREDVLSS